MDRIERGKALMKKLKAERAEREKEAEKKKEAKPTPSKKGKLKCYTRTANDGHKYVTCDDKATASKAMAKVREAMKEVNGIKGKPKLKKQFAEKAKAEIDRDLPDDVLKNIKEFAAPQGLFKNTHEIWREDDGPHRLLRENTPISEADMKSVIKQLKNEGVVARWTEQGSRNEKHLEIVAPRKKVPVVDDARYKMTATIIDTPYEGGIIRVDYFDKKNNKKNFSVGKNWAATMYQYQGVPMRYIKKLIKINDPYETSLRIENGRIIKGILNKKTNRYEDVK